MATLKQLHLPDDLLAAIKRRADAEGISVEEQVVRELTVADHTISAGDPALLEDIRRGRDAMAAKGVFLTDEMLAEAKSWGRE